MKFVIQVHINSPPHLVNQAYINPENMPYWTKYLERFEVVRGHVAEAGALGRLHFKKKGRSYTMEDELLETEPGKRYRSRVSGQGITAEVETLLAPAEGGTLLTLRWKGKSKPLLFNVMLHLLRGKIKREATSELVAFKKLVETQGINFS
jgi:hypothetical protein